MKRQVVTGAVIAALLAGQTSFAASGSESCRAHSVSGQALVQSGGGWTALSDGSLTQGTRIRTGAEGALVLKFDNGNSFRIAPHSELVVGASGAAELQLHRGRILARATSPVEVQTTASVVRAKAAEFVLATDASGAHMSVLDGEPAMSGFDGAKPEYPQVAEVPAGVDPALLALGSSTGQQYMPAVGNANLVTEQSSKAKPKKNKTNSSGSTNPSWFTIAGGSLGAGLVGILAGGSGAGSGSEAVVSSPGAQTMAGPVFEDSDAALFTINALEVEDCCYGPEHPPGYEPTAGARVSGHF